MRNVIFGSGIVGLMAGKLLGSSWTVIPFGRSRFYSFNPPLADNFIIHDSEIDEPIRDLTGQRPVHIYRRCWSVGGLLDSTWNEGICNSFLAKLFGDSP